MKNVILLGPIDALIPNQAHGHHPRDRRSVPCAVISAQEGTYGHAGSFFLGAESEKINLEQKIMSILALRINAKRLVISCVVLAEDAPASQERTG